DYGGQRVDEIRALRDETRKKRIRWLELAAALEELDAMLRAEAKGFSLQPLYAKVPPMLRGYVELVYDLNNNPSFRLLESLLYRSPLYEKDAQSLVLEKTAGDDRPFVLSTPRLESDDMVQLRIPFADELVDRLFQMKAQPQPLASILD